MKNYSVASHRGTQQVHSKISCYLFNQYHVHVIHFCYFYSICNVEKHSSCKIVNWCLLISENMLLAHWFFREPFPTILPCFEIFALLYHHMQIPHFYTIPALGHNFTITLILGTFWDWQRNPGQHNLRSVLWYKCLAWLSKKTHMESMSAQKGILCVHVTG